MRLIYDASPLFDLKVNELSFVLQGFNCDLKHQVKALEFSYSMNPTDDEQHY